MDYNSISSFLDKFKEILFKGEEVNKTISQVIENHILSPIEVSKIKIKGTTIYIQGSPMLHSEVLIHKTGILSDLSNLIPERNFKDIR